MSPGRRGKLAQKEIAYGEKGVRSTMGLGDVNLPISYVGGLSGEVDDAAVVRKKIEKRDVRNGHSRKDQGCETGG